MRRSTSHATISWASIVCFTSLMPLTGCDRAAGNLPKNNPPAPESTAAAPSSTAPSIAPPKAQILFQPEFVWASGKRTHQGTGFFVLSPEGKLAGVTSAHFLDEDGPALLEARWLTIGTTYAMARFTTSWGPVGKDKLNFSEIDRRSDYLIMPTNNTVKPDSVLELDSRPMPERNERVWLPNKDPTVYGYRNVGGTVEEASEKYIKVLLDNGIKVQSQSGSPIISQRTGKVIGTFSRGGQRESQTWVILTPAKSIADVLTRHRDFPELMSVVGRFDPSSESQKAVVEQLRIERSIPTEILKDQPGVRTTLNSTWTTDGESVFSPHVNPGVLLLPKAPRLPYRVSLTAQRVFGTSSLDIGIVTSAGQALIVLNAGQYSGLSLLDDQPVGYKQNLFDGWLLGREKPAAIQCDVAEARIVVHCNGETIFDWDGEHGRLQLPPKLKNIPPDRVFLSTDYVTYRISGIEVTELDEANVGQ